MKRGRQANIWTVERFIARLGIASLGRGIEESVEKGRA
jgi:hypothetical protein